MDFQFYPTPPALAAKAWAKFKNKNFVRVLDPEAGRGDLVKACPWYARNYTKLQVDCCEIDFSMHASLRELSGVNIVGFDFMEFGGGAIYSHIIMNPPFADGASHVLKAWDVLWDGEIVAIINAETLRNPHTRERNHLLSLVERYGEVEFIENAFAGADAERKTDVEIALVYLRKTANVGESILGTVLSDLQTENAAKKAESLAKGFEQRQELTIPTTVIENSVLTFEAAVDSMRAAVMASARETYYSGLLGDTMAVRSGACIETPPVQTSVDWVKSQIALRYLNLKDKAWAGMLRSSQVTDKLSSAAQKRVESEFEAIKELEFTVANIFGFMAGLMESQGQIQIDMACDVFDLITRYHTDNVCFYKGWKSNDNHRTCGMRIKTTRFVIPGNESYKGSRNLSFDALNKMADFDKVFAMLDGKQQSDVSLAIVFRDQFKQMCGGERVSSSYFDTRYYPGAATIHFFPTNKVLVDKLNKLVGEHRRWLPKAEENVSETFWQQFERAEKFDKELRAELDARERAKRLTGMRISQWEHPLQRLNGSEGEGERSRAAIDDAMTAVLERHGISVDFQLQGPSANEQEQLLLAA